MPLIEATGRGLYCEAGRFFIDPLRPVEKAVVTHAHADHARPGCEAYLCTDRGAAIVRHRIGRRGVIEALPFGQRREINGVSVSLHPAGHLLGSAQVRVEHQGEVWVVSGDYKTSVDPSCEAFEPVRCHTFITECTFGLPIYSWPHPSAVFSEINAWWRGNQEQGLTSILFAYALGKSQQVIGGVDSSIGSILVHGAVEPFLPLYRAQGIQLPDTLKADRANGRAHRGRALVIAPGSARNTPWLRPFAPFSLACPSGWMRVRGARRRQALDRGFLLSGHAGWDELLSAIDATGAQRIGATHGQTAPLVRYLREQKGLDAWELPGRHPSRPDASTGTGSNEEVGAG